MNYSKTIFYSRFNQHSKFYTLGVGGGVWVTTICFTFRQKEELWVSMNDRMLETKNFLVAETK
jgi:hypothetical protein